MEMVFNKGEASMRQAVHVDAYLVRTIRGHYVKTNSKEGVSYVMYQTARLAEHYIINEGLDAYIVPVRVAITPTISGRTRRVVAVPKTQPEEVSQAHQTNL